VNDVSIQTELGKAFEYACLQALNNLRDMGEREGAVIPLNLLRGGRHGGVAYE